MDLYTWAHIYTNSMMEVWSKYNQGLVGIYTIQCAIYMMLLDHMHTLILYIFAMTELISSQKNQAK